MEWLLNGAIGLVSATGGFFVGWAALRNSRTSSRSALEAERAELAEDRRSLIEQLQEERSVYVAQLSAERAELAAERQVWAERFDRMWADKAASRQHVAALRAHIWSRGEPPPPDPPAGYQE